MKTTLLSLRNIEYRTLKTETNRINQMLPYISTNDITELNDLIYAGVKLVYEKIGVPTKKYEETVKTRMGSSTGNPDKKSTKTSQNGKTERSWNRWEENWKDNTRKNNSTTWGNKPEGSGERRETKKISIKGKTLQTKQDIPKLRKKIFISNWKGMTYQQPDARETERFWMKIWQPKKHIEKAEGINDLTRELGLEEGPKAEMHIELLKKTLKKITNWKKARTLWNFGSRNLPPFKTD